MVNYSYNHSTNAPIATVQSSAPLIVCRPIVNIASLLPERHHYQAHCQVAPMGYLFRVAELVVQPAILCLFRCMTQVHDCQGWSRGNSRNGGSGIF
jgi:hypothetical protein